MNALPSLRSFVSIIALAADKSTQLPGRLCPTTSDRKSRQTTHTI